MSVQTGALPPSGPVSQRLVDRAKYRVDRWKTEPNPIWMRELRQAARLGRTPIILMVVTILMTLLIAAIGGIVSTEEAPATTGVVIFQVFFSLAYFVVTVVGPAVAANSIASEREGRTWEAVILTGLDPGQIARGKFLAAYTAIGMYIVMLAPVGALSFLFGGVTAMEVVVAFFFLFLIALLSVAFGLAISSKMTSLRVAIVVTLLLAFPITITSYLSFGLGLSFAAHKAWPGVAEGPPVWLPTAYERAPFDLTYVLCLILIPIAAVTLPAWFLYEVTVANLTSVTDNRSTGLKRWFLVAAPVLTVIAASPVLAADAMDHDEMAITGLSVVFIFLSFCVFLFAGDPVGPSRRVQAQWDQTGAGRFHRFLGPGVMRSATLLATSGALALLALTAFCLFVIQLSGYASSSTQAAQVVAFAAYALSFYVLTVGLGAWLRSRATSSLVARVLLFTILFAIAVGPWIVAAIGGLLASRGGGDEALLVASPSPFYAFVMVNALDKSSPEAAVIAGGVCSALWAVSGLVLLGAAQRKCAAVIQQHEAALAQTDQLLAQEDEAAAAAAEAASAPAEAGESPAGPDANLADNAAPSHETAEPPPPGEPAAS